MKKFILSENTLMPVSLVITMAGAIYWIASVSFATDENARDIAAIVQTVQSGNDEISGALKEQSETLGNLRSQVSAVDARLQALGDYIRHENARLRKRDD